VWESDVEWNGVDGHFHEESDGLRLPNIGGISLSGDVDYSRQSMSNFRSNQTCVYAGVFPNEVEGSPLDPDVLATLVALHCEQDTEFYRLQAQLVKNFTVKKEKGLIAWT
jgi:hypothetical protein